MEENTKFNTKFIPVKMILLCVLICISFTAGILICYSSGIKRADYENLQSANSQLNEELLNIQNQYNDYKQTMQSYEEIYELDQANIAEEQNISRDRSKKENAEKRAVEQMEEQIAKEIMTTNKETVSFLLTSSEIIK